MPLASKHNETVRVFLALWPDVAARARLAACRDAWHWPQGARLVSDVDLHLTLHFIGALARSRLDALKAGLADVPTAGFSLSMRDGEVWRGGIAVLRANSSPLALVALHERLGRSLDGLGIDFDTRPFAPHVTLARKARGARPPATTDSVEWAAEGFALIESARVATARYRVVRRFGPREASLH
jgi:2'-5' RNA ligase